jgi:pullulanase
MERSNKGDDLLRSKDMDGNSFDSGDWFNKWTSATSPTTGAPVCRLPAPLPADIAHSRDAYRELLQIRGSSDLFHMATQAEVQAKTCIS